jgi:hypothetical protein
MDNHLVRVPVRRTGRLLAVLMLVVALVIIALAPMVSAETVVPAATVPGDRPAGDAPGTVGLDAWSCPDNLLLNPSFELGNGSFNAFWGDPVPANWTLQGSGFTGATTLYGPPDGNRIGYVIHTSPSSAGAIMYQQVAVVAGTTYNMTFYSGSHEPSKQPTIAIRFYDGSGIEIGTGAIHTITSDIDTSGMGGPYTLSGTAPEGAANLRVIFTDPASTATPFVYAGAKGDALCLLKPKPPTAVSLAGFSASGGQMPWGGFALLGAVLAGLVVTQRRQQR